MIYTGQGAADRAMDKAIELAYHNHSTFTVYDRGDDRFEVINGWDGYAGLVAQCSGCNPAWYARRMADRKSGRA